MLIRIACLAIASTIVFAGLTQAEPKEPSQPILRGSVSAATFFASFDGSLQTPLGGANGSTNRNRPTTHEVGLKGVEVHPFVDVELRLFERHALHASYAHLVQKANDRLTKNLTTHGQTVPVGARVRSQLNMPFLRLGYRALWLPLSISSWTFVPELGAARLNFHYRLRSKEASGRIDREYVIYFVYWGFHSAATLLPALRAEVDLFASAGLSNMISIDSDFRLVYRVFEHGPVAASVVVGLRGIWLRYKDDQRDEQNLINVRTGAFSTKPWAGAHLGMRLDF